MNASTLNCPNCNGQTEFNGTGGIVCHFCGYNSGDSMPSQHRKKSRIYVAGPYSHPDAAVRETRFKLLTKAAAALLQAGFQVYSPITHNHPLVKSGVLPTGWDFWQTHDLPMLKQCDRLAVICLPGWEKSTGVAGEIEHAKKWGLEITHYLPENLGISPQEILPI